MNSELNKVKRVCVIGAGVMGSGIAAQAANAGADVLLLDVVEGAAEGAIKKMLKTKPAPLMHKSFAKRIQPGTVEGDLESVSECDWVIEVIIERADIKQQLYRDLAQHLREDAVLSSNTSTLPLEILTEGMIDDLKSRFLITHFFNPPRYMRLLEVITGPETDANAVAKVLDFADRHMGKSIVRCNDTPGFIANRIGTYWLHCAVTEAIRRGIGVEEADAVLGRPIGVPKTGVFALLDLVGLDLMPHVLKSFEDTLPEGDAFHELGPAPEQLQTMIDAGYTGRKGKGGFYRLDKDRNKEVMSLLDGSYALAKRPKPAALKASRKLGLQALFTHESAEGTYAWSVMSKTLSYAVQHAPDIAGDIEAVDRAMRLGYNWKWGPFELIDKMSPAWFADYLEAQDMEVPAMLAAVGNKTFYRVQDGKLHRFNGTRHVPVERTAGTISLADIKLTQKPMFSNPSASVWDIGDGVACLEFTSKMNSLDPLILWIVNKAVKELPARGFKGLVIYNEGSNFSVGANIAMVLIAGKLHLWPLVQLILSYGQNTFRRLKYSPFPVVGAPGGMSLGGGCEVLLHCDRLTPHAETYIGLVEAAVGIVPGWGGCKELLVRWTQTKDRPGGPMPPVMRAFETIATAEVATSAFEARDHQFVRNGDEIVMNRDRVLATAKQNVLELAVDYTPPDPLEMRLPGPGGRAALMLAVNDFVNKGVATPHDATIARELARVLSGGDTDVMDICTEADVLKLEREADIRLAKTPETMARITAMLKTGKPLRN